MIVTTQDVIILILGLYIGLLLNKLNILTWERACLPFVVIKALTLKITTWGNHKNAKNSKENNEAPKL